MSNKRIRKKHSKKIIKAIFKNEFEIEKMKASPKLTFRQCMILFDYFTYNILRFADDSPKAKENLKKIIELRYVDLEEEDGEVD